MRPFQHSVGWGRFASWHQRQQQAVGESQPGHALTRILQSQINAYFLLVTILEAIIISVGNATANQEFAEVTVIVFYVVLLAILTWLNRVGRIHFTTFAIALLPTIGLILAYSLPLPSGVWQLNWSYDAGLFTPIPGILLLALIYRPLVVSPLVIIGMILLVELFICFVMPQAPSLVQTDIIGGIISPHWPTWIQHAYTLYDFSYCPVLILLMVTWVGTWTGGWIRKLLSH